MGHVLLSCRNNKVSLNELTKILVFTNPNINIFSDLEQYHFDHFTWIYSKTNC